jgi:hypothetical protein
VPVVFKETGSAALDEILSGDRVPVLGACLAVIDDDLLQASQHTEEFWLRYQLLSNLPTREGSNQGWTQNDQGSALLEAAHEYQTNLRNAVGDEALSMHALDPRQGWGNAYQGGILLTHLVNVAVSYQFLMNGGILPNDSLVLQIADNTGLIGFMLDRVMYALQSAFTFSTNR